MADDDHRTDWNQIPRFYPQSQHGTPAQEHSGVRLPTLHMPTEVSASAMHAFGMPSWPSMLNGQPYLDDQPVQSTQPISMAPLQTAMSITSSRSTLTPRRKLADGDYEQIRQYAHDYPKSTRTEIGRVFGVDRSTVSNVLRYVKEERALSVWAKNEEKKGNTLSDDLIQNKARTLMACTDNHDPLSSSRLEKFKLKHNLMKARSPEASPAADDDSTWAAVSSSHIPRDTSPVSVSGLGSASKPTASPTPSPTTPEEARQALAVLLSFFEQLPNGCLDLHEGVIIGKLMEKLKLLSRSGS